MMRRIAVLHVDHGSHGSLSELLADKLGRFGEFVDEVILHGFIDTLKLVLFLFLTYLLMEYIEHKASDKVKGAMTRAGKLGPVIGGIFGAVPQCGFSAAAANLYTGRVITLGTLLAVFLATSDEMLPMLVAGNMKIGNVLTIILYKTAVGIAMGFAVDLALKLMKREKEKINIDEICDNDNCHCENGIVASAIHHTLNVSLFVLLVSFVVNTVTFFALEEVLSGSVFALPVVSHILSALIGLIPNCAVSVALTRFAMSGVISAGAMMSGLFAGAGVGVLILFRMNRRPKENAMIVALLLIIGVVFGLLADLIGISLL